jgi:hypothetical protein
VLADYHGVPALKTWNAPVIGYVPRPRNKERK